MKAIGIALVFAIVLLTPVNLHAQNPSNPIFDQLLASIIPEFNKELTVGPDYKTLTLSISKIGPNRANLTEEAVKSRTELRMRSAGLKPRDGNSPSLNITVTMTASGSVYAIEAEFKRFASWSLEDGTTGIGKGVVTTWSDGVIGDYGTKGTSYLLEQLDLVLDRFLNAYLKANQDKK